MSWLKRCEHQQAGGRAHGRIDYAGHGDPEELRRKGNRELYWNYLAQTPGNDGYGLLALGVVRNDNMPGALANQYAQNRAQSVRGVRMSERQWDAFGQDLMRDYEFRQAHFDNGEAVQALNLPVKEVQIVHDQTFGDTGITPDAWTPRPLLEAARRHEASLLPKGVADHAGQPGPGHRGAWWPPCRTRRTATTMKAFRPPAMSVN
ncbi:MAG: hypothetical protein R3E56_10550 [Burkholderiaceae bacterium]